MQRWWRKNCHAFRPEWGNSEESGAWEGEATGGSQLSGTPLIMCLYLIVAAIRLKFSQRENVSNKQVPHGDSPKCRGIAIFCLIHSDKYFA